MKQGFTLIELLAVIVTIAIIDLLYMGSAWGNGNSYYLDNVRFVKVK